MASFTSPRGPFLLPLELIDNIVHEVVVQAFSSRYRTNALCTLCRICKAFYFSAQSRLLTSIDLSLSDTQTAEERAAVLVDILLKDPSLHQRIRSLKVVFKGPNDGPVVPASLLRLLDLAVKSTSLKKLSIEWYRYESTSPAATEPLRWSQLDPEPASPLIKEIHANPSLESLQLVNIRKVPPYLLLSKFQSRSFHDLVLKSTFFTFLNRRTFADWELSLEALERIGVLTLSSASVTSISLLCDEIKEHPSFKPFPSPVFFKCLHTLCIEVPEQTSFYFFIQVIESVSRTLETLELWTYAANLDGLNLWFSLESLTMLKTYKFYTLLDISNATIESEKVASHMQALRRSLSTAPSSSPLSNIHIGFFIDIQDPHTHRLSNPTPHLNILYGIDWAPIDEMHAPLYPSRSSVLPALQHISVQIERYYNCSKGLGIETRSKDKDYNIPLSNIFPRTCQRLSLQQTDIVEMYTTYTSEHVSGIFSRPF
ncbi:hypothetical protein BDN70DRAFT_871068 [Pholiota conissans]|uniref:Uncharacterized protein n=1 Tax=Pholiota conissans TaxID=109636 RepID=A0A9P6D7J3_9AGAR|nr:hypothetical protein BDN70DRAFT_871068 [Pholiota conissans]